MESPGAHHSNVFGVCGSADIYPTKVYPKTFIGKSVHLVAFLVTFPGRCFERRPDFCLLH